MTYLDAINKVLQRLREDTVSTSDENDYSALIGDFVNETIREIEDAWDWNVLKTTLELTTEDDSFRHILTGSNLRSKIYSVYDYTNKRRLEHMMPSEMNRRFMTEQTVQNDKPRYWSHNGVNSSGVPQIDLYPIPDGAYTLYVHLKIPTDDITDDTEVINLPTKVVVLGAYAKALQERGEDLGTNLQMALRSYELALGDAIALDAAHNVLENDWYV